MMKIIKQSLRGYVLSASLAARSRLQSRKNKVQARFDKWAQESTLAESPRMAQIGSALTLASFACVDIEASPLAASLNLSPNRDPDHTCNPNPDPSANSNPDGH